YIRDKRRKAAEMFSQMDPKVCSVLPKFPEAVKSFDSIKKAFNFLDELEEENSGYLGLQMTMV
ncbi:hypothetical protein ACFL7M_14735, partial [Thermodesulfobacteriota bacterium]